MATTTLIIIILLITQNLTTVFAENPRRILHEPLFPIQWTPPPPPDSNPFPETPTPPSPFFPDAPPSQSGDIQTPNLPNSSQLSSHRRSNSSKNVIIGVSAAIGLLALAALFTFFLYRWRTRRSRQDRRKLIGGDDGGVARFQQPAAPEFFYLGTIEPAAAERRRVSESNDSPSPYRKLSSERMVEVHHPSPELQPLPPLIGPTSGLRVPSTVAVTALSDDDGFYTPNRSVASLTSDSPSSPVSRRSLPGSFGRKEVNMIAADNPRSRRTSPRMQFSDSPPSHIKHAIPPTNQLPPMPPPPPPPPPKPERISRRPPPPPPPPPPQFQNSEALPAAVVNIKLPSSRRQLLRPLPAEATRIDMTFLGSRLSNGSSSSLQIADEGGENLVGDEKLKLKPLHWDKVRASSDRAMVWDQLKSSSFQ